MNPSVTLAIPTKNRIGFLRQALRDALDQDYPNLEILVSDNGSTDGTRAWVETVARENSRLRYRRNEESVSIISHFNQCLDAANGDFFILFCDDDRINRSFVSGLVHGLSQNPRATAAIPTNAIIDDFGNLERILPLPQTHAHRGIEFVSRWLWKTEELPVANLLTVMGRTETMRNLRYQPFENGLNSDNLLFLQLALSGDVVFCPEAIFYWRNHSRQTGSSAPLRRMQKAGRQFLDFVQSANHFPSLLAQPPDRQQMIRDGIRQMNAEAQLYGSGFFEKPFGTRTLRNLLATPLHFDMWRLALRFYGRRIRQRLLVQNKFPFG